MYVYAAEHTRDGQRVTSMINAKFGSCLRGLPLGSNELPIKRTITRKQALTKFNSIVIVSWMTIENENSVDIMQEKL